MARYLRPLLALCVLMISFVNLGCTATTPVTPDAAAASGTATPATFTLDGLRQTPDPTARPTETNVPTRVASIVQTNTPMPRPTTSATGTGTNLDFLGAVIDVATSDFRARGGLVSLYIEDLTSGDRLSRDPDIAIAAMSLVKIPIMLETYRSLSGPPDVYYTDLLTQTAVLSGNFTANLLLGLLDAEDDPFAGAAAVTNALRNLGLVNTFIAVPYDSDPRPDWPATYLTPANSRLDVTTFPDPNMQTTVGDMGALLGLIYACSQDSGPLPDANLSAADCAEILALLMRNQIDALLEGGLPDGIDIAHKHGWIGDTHGDAGIVYTEGGDYVIVVALYFPQWLEWGVSNPLIAEISRLAYAHFNADQPYPTGFQPPPTPTPPLILEGTGPRAIIFGTGGAGAYLRAEPGGAELRVLAEGGAVRLLEGRVETADGTIWQEVSVIDGVTGWVVASFLLAAP